MVIKRLGKLPFYLATMLFWFSMYTYVPILTPYVRVLGGSVFMAGLVVGSYGFTQMLIRIPLGMWSDKIGVRKPFVLAGILCSTLSGLFFGMTDSLWLTLLFRAFAGIAAGSWVAFTVLFSQSYPPGQAPKAMGLLSFWTGIGQMMAMALGGLFAQWYGWHAPFYLGVAGGILSFLCALLIPEQPENRTKDRAHPIVMLVETGKDFNVLSVSLLAVIVQALSFVTMFGFTPLYATQIGATKAQLGLLSLLTTAPNALAGFLTGTMIVRKMGPRAIVVSGFLFAAVATAMIPLTHSFGFLLVSQALNGFGQGLVLPVLMGLSIAHVPTNRRATAMGFFQAVYSLGMFGGPSIVGAMSNAIGISSGFYVTAIVALFGAGLSLWWITNRRPPSDQY